MNGGSDPDVPGTGAPDVGRAGWPSGASTILGIIGDPIAHTLSPALHNAALRAVGLDWVFVAFKVRDGDAAPALAGMRALSLRGLAVTMPHKHAVAGLVDRCSEVAQSLGAVNCVTNATGFLEGDNTDGEGFVASLRRGAGFDPAGKRCLVAGAGGAARAVVLALARAGATEVVVVNRTAERAVRAAALAGPVGRVGVATDATDVELVVDATPTGMAGIASAGAPPLVDAGLVGSGQLVVDLVYHPLRTPWLDAAHAGGATVLGGLGMLVHQAAAQFERWTGREAPVDVMWAAAQAAVSASPGPGSPTRSTREH